MSPEEGFKLMCPGLSYDEALCHMEIAPLSVPHKDICATLFKDTLTVTQIIGYEHSHKACKYLKINTKRVRSSFMIKSCFNTNTV